jgi:hypothetical protein
VLSNGTEMAFTNKLVDRFGCLLQDFYRCAIDNTETFAIPKLDPGNTKPLSSCNNDLGCSPFVFGSIPANWFLEKKIVRFRLVRCDVTKFVSDVIVCDLICGVSIGGTN